MEAVAETLLNLKKKNMPDGHKYVSNAGRGASVTPVKSASVDFKANEGRLGSDCSGVVSTVTGQAAQNNTQKWDGLEQTGARVHLDLLKL